jgi:hypothetical protein
MGTLFFSTPKKQYKPNKMPTISKKLLCENNEASEFWLNHDKELETLLTTPLTGEGDVGKLKMLTERFPFADFHLTNKTTGITYQLAYDYTGPQWCPSVRWYRGGVGFLCSSQHNFPRPCKIVMTSCSGFKKDVTYLFK